MILFLLPLDFGGHSLRAQTFLRCAVFISLSFWLVLNNKIIPRFAPFLILAFLFLILSFASCVFSGYKYLSFSVWIDYLSFFIVFFLASNVIKDELIELAPLVLFFSALWVTIVGAYFFLLTNFMEIEASFYSTFYQQDVYAGFILIVLPLGIVMYLGSVNLRENIFYGIGSLLMSIGLVLSHSRGAWLIFLLIIPLIFYAVKASINRRVWVKLLIFLILAFIGTFYFADVQKKGKSVPSLKEEAVSSISINDASYHARLEFYRAALGIVKDHPAFGTGFGSFGDFYPRYIKDGRFYSKYVHNLYLELACGAGLLQALIFILILGLIFKGALRALKKTSGRKSLLISGISIGLLAGLMHAFIDVDWQFPAVCVYFFFLAGIIQALRFNGESRASAGVSMSVRYITAFILILSLPFIIFPYFAESFSQAGILFEKCQNYKKAYDCYKGAVKFNPFNFEYHKSLASLYLTKQGVISMDEAFREARKAVILNPEKAVLHQFLAKFYLEKKDTLSFLNQINIAIEKDPVNYPSFYNDLAALYFNKGDLSSAEKYYLKAVKLFPDKHFEPMWYFRISSVKRQLSESYLGLGRIYLIEGKQKEALECFKKVKEFGYIKINIVEK